MTWRRRPHPRPTTLPGQLHIRPRSRYLYRLCCIAALALFALSGPAPAARADTSPGDTLMLSASAPSPQPVGTPITFTATISGTATPVYRFSVGPVGGPYSIVRDYSPHTSFTWTPLQEGSYEVQVMAKDGYGAADASADEATLPYTVTSLVTGTAAVISPTANPLVALYSAPPCSDGEMDVMFRAITDTTWTDTAAQPCQAGVSRNFLVAGMEANTTYLLQDMISGTVGITLSVPQSYTTGAPPSALTFPSFTVPQPPSSQADLGASTLFHMLIPTPAGYANPVATDLDGNVVWYYDMLRSGLSSVWPVSLVPGGTVLLLGNDYYQTSAYDVLREVDLAGDIVRETNIDVINAELAAAGTVTDTVYGFSHDAQRLPNGDTAVLGYITRTVNGHAMVGELLIVLDANFQVTWTWNPFDHLDTNRHAILGETCYSDPCGVANRYAEDWLHTNAIGWSPTDGDLTLSLRHQDWVIKIDYDNGSGSGNVVWRLGQGGDFSLTNAADPGDPYPWFSHQHNAHFVDPTTMVLFDNGNTRCQGSSGCHSRGQVFSLDEQGYTATLLLNVDVGSYSGALGSAERLSNGNYVFGSGLIYPGPVGQSIEVSPDGTKVYVQQVNNLEYRSFRVSDLYSGTNPPYEPCSDTAACSTPTGTPAATGTLPVGTSTGTAAAPTATDSGTGTTTAAPTGTLTPTTTTTAAPSGTPMPTATTTAASTGTPVPTTTTTAASTGTPVPTATVTVTPEATTTTTPAPSTATPTPGQTGLPPATSTVVASATGTMPSATSTPAATSTIPSTGFLSLCKEGEGALAGNFTFTVAGRTITVPANSCSSAFTVPAGVVTITEVGRSDTALTGVTAIPQARLVSGSVDLTGRSAQVRIEASTDGATGAVVTFVDQELTPTPTYTTATTPASTATATSPGATNTAAPPSTSPQQETATPPGLATATATLPSVTATASPPAVTPANAPQNTSGPVPTYTPTPGATAQPVATIPACRLFVPLRVALPRQVRGGGELRAIVYTAPGARVVASLLAPPARPRLLAQAQGQAGHRGVFIARVRVPFRPRLLEPADVTVVARLDCGHGTRTHALRVVPDPTGPPLGLRVQVAGQRLVPRRTVIQIRLSNRPGARVAVVLSLTRSVRVSVRGKRTTRVLTLYARRFTMTPGGTGVVTRSVRLSYLPPRTEGAMLTVQARDGAGGALTRRLRVTVVHP